MHKSDLLLCPGRDGIWTAGQLLQSEFYKNINVYGAAKWRGSCILGIFTEVSVFCTIYKLPLAPIPACTTWQSCLEVDCFSSTSVPSYNRTKAFQGLVSLQGKQYFSYDQSIQVTTPSISLALIFDMKKQIKGWDFSPTPSLPVSPLFPTNEEERKEQTSCPPFGQMERWASQWRGALPKSKKKFSGHKG